VHLADGVFTEPAVVAGLDLVGAGALGIAVRHADARDGRVTAFTGTLAAFVLAAQAINVPVLPGTSAHVIGATLVTLAVGPARAVIALTAVLIIQALVLGDGGITVLGINVLDLAVLPTLSVELVARVLGRSGLALRTTAVLGTLLGNVAGASALAAALVVGAGASARIAFPWLVGVHALTGLVEGILTALALGELERRAPDLLYSPSPESRDRPRSYRAAIAWTAVGIGVATALLPLTSAKPDALERFLAEPRAR